jgi:hypothetical protein
MPAVLLPGSREAPAPSAGADPSLAPPPAPSAGADPALAPPLVPPAAPPAAPPAPTYHEPAWSELAPAPRRRVARPHRRGPGPLVAALLALLVLAVVAIGAALALGLGDDLLPGLAGGPQAPPAATGEAPPDDGDGVDDADRPTERPAAADGQFSCDPQQLDAPEAGGWQLYRASFGTRSRFDYLTLHLRRVGGGDGTASVRAEIASAAEVSERYGVGVPGSADRALVASLDGPVRIGGPFGGRPGNRALREFEVVRDDDGTVHVVAAIDGDGCFALSSEDWQAGQAPRTSEVMLRIESR